MNITIHQALHGYQQGHNLIAASVGMSSADAMQMAMLSDWTEYTNSLDESDYITAYPLKDSNYYVIAKSWYAEEMERPGCVWTHSLLIAFDDLAKINDYRIFLQLFKRPIKDNYYEYAIPISVYVNLDITNHKAKKINLPSMPNVYNQLINQKPQVYGVEMTSLWYQILCLTLMNYFPYKMLKGLTFSTGGSYIRTIEGKPFSLQFVSGRNDLTSIHKPSSDNVSKWIIYAAANIESDNLSLSKLIHIFAEDLGSDSQLLQSFLYLYTISNGHYLTEADKELAMRTIIDTIADTYPTPNQGHLIKQRFLQPPVCSFFVSEDIFLYNLCVYDKVQNFSMEDIDFLNRFKKLTTSITKHQLYLFLAKLCNSNDKLNNWGKIELAKSDKILNESDIIFIASNSWKIYAVLSEYCPELLNKIHFEDLSTEHIITIIELILKNEDKFVHWNKLLLLILNKGIGISQKILDLIYKHEENTINIILDYINNSIKVPTIDMLTSICSRNTSKVINWLKDIPQINTNVCKLIMLLINPASNTIRNRDSITWKSFADYSSNHQASAVYYSFLYILSFNWEKDKNAIEYLRKSFYPLYKSTAENKLDDKIWYSIMPYTDEVPFWLTWDKCKKMRKKVGRRLAIAGMTKEYVSNFTSDQELNDKLVHIWERNQ